MIKLANIEGDQVVIQIPVAAFSAAASQSGLVITDLASLVPQFVSAVDAEGWYENLHLKKVLDA